MEYLTNHMKAELYAQLFKQQIERPESYLCHPTKGGFMILLDSAIAQNGEINHMEAELCPHLLNNELKFEYPISRITEDSFISLLVREIVCFSGLIIWLWNNLLDCL